MLITKRLYRQLSASSKVLAAECLDDPLHTLKGIGNLVLNAGALSRDQHELFLRNPRFSGLKFPNMSRPETLERKYGGKLHPDALSFIR